MRIEEPYVNTPDKGSHRSIVAFLTHPNVRSAMQMVRVLWPEYLSGAATQVQKLRGKKCYISNNLLDVLMSEAIKSSISALNSPVCTSPYKAMVLAIFHNILSGSCLDIFFHRSISNFKVTKTDINYIIRYCKLFVLMGYICSEMLINLFTLQQAGTKFL